MLCSSMTWTFAHPALVAMAQASGQGIPVRIVGVLSGLHQTLSDTVMTAPPDRPLARG